MGGTGLLPDGKSQECCLIFNYIIKALKVLLYVTGICHDFFASLSCFQRSSHIFGVVDSVCFLCQYVSLQCQDLGENAWEVDNQYFFLLYLNLIENFPRKEKKPRPEGTSRNYVKNSSLKKISRDIWTGLHRQKTLTLRMMKRLMKKASGTVCVLYSLLLCGTVQLPLRVLRWSECSLCDVAFRFAVCKSFC